MGKLAATPLSRPGSSRSAADAKQNSVRLADSTMKRAKDRRKQGHERIRRNATVWRAADALMSLSEARARHKMPPPLPPLTLGRPTPIRPRPPLPQYRPILPRAGCGSGIGARTNLYPHLINHDPDGNVAAKSGFGFGPGGKMAARSSAAAPSPLPPLWPLGFSGKMAARSSAAALTHLPPLWPRPKLAFRGWASGWSPKGSANPLPPLRPFPPTPPPPPPPPPQRQEQRQKAWRPWEIVSPLPALRKKDPASRPEAAIQELMVAEQRAEQKATAFLERGRNELRAQQEAENKRLREIRKPSVKVPSKGWNEVARVGPIGHGVWQIRQPLPTRAVDHKLLLKRTSDGLNDDSRDEVQQIDRRGREAAEEMRLHRIVAAAASHYAVKYSDLDRGRIILNRCRTDVFEVDRQNRGFVATETKSE